MSSIGERIVGWGLDSDAYRPSARPVRVEDGL
jgi:hypothetical protein